MAGRKRTDQCSRANQPMAGRRSIAGIHPKRTGKAQNGLLVSVAPKAINTAASAAVMEIGRAASHANTAPAMPCVRVIRPGFTGASGGIIASGIGGTLEHPMPTTNSPPHPRGQATGGTVHVRPHWGQVRCMVMAFLASRSDRRLPAGQCNTCRLEAGAPALSRPQHTPIQIPVLNRLGKVRYADLRRGVKVGDGAGEFEDAVVGAS